MGKPKVLCLYVSLPEEVTKETLLSIRTQTLPVTKLVMVTERSTKPTLPERISEVINHALEKEDLRKYKYVLRVDADSVLPNNFLEANLAMEPDIMGFGNSQIIKVETFLKVMGGRLHPKQDDTYIRHKFAVAGFPSSTPVVKAMSKRTAGTTHDIIGYNTLRGMLMFQSGIMPVHILFNHFYPSKENFWILVGYFKALLTRTEGFDTAIHMRRTHIATTMKPEKMLSRLRRRFKIGFKPAWLQGPQVLQLDTHNFCNEKCKYCNVEFLSNGKHGFMSLDVAQQAVMEVKDVVRHVKLFLNGDALLEKRLGEFSAMVKEINPEINVIIFTNGAQFSNRQLLVDKNLDEVHFTFSANTPETYAIVHGKPYFHDALKTIFWFAKNKLPNQKIVIHYVTMEDNVNELVGWNQRFTQFERMVTPLHCTLEQKVSQQLLDGSDKTLKLAAWVDSLDESTPCNCWSNMAISFDGRILQCCDSSYKVNYGRVGKTSLLKAWQRRLENKMKNPACRKCNIKNPDYKRILDEYIEVGYYMEKIKDR
jgi:MoaA/NifB/PqqE/SkfB family radical SAM enzyme